jgi:hypothetical protein
VTSVAIQATGVRFDQVAAGQLSSPSPEQRAEHVAWERGDLVFVTATAFVEFTDDRGEQRWMGTPQRPYGIPLEVDATSLLLDLVERPDDLLPDLGISDLKVGRFDFYAAPRRIELADDLRRRLLLR